MKRLCKVFLFWLLPLTLFANHIYWQGNYDKALHQAHTEHKPLLVLVINQQDNKIDDILKTSLMNQTYIDIINKEMIAVMVTYEGRSSYPIEMFYTRVFPTLFFVDSQTETFIHEPLYGEQITRKVLLRYLRPFLLKTKSPQH